MGGAARVAACSRCGNRCGARARTRTPPPTHTHTHANPRRWQSFLPDIVAASKTNETLCENTMAILKLLSEEVFDFSRGEMTQDKTRHLKHTLNAQFRMIHELCTFVLLNTRKESLVRATLTALHAYLSWVPVG